MSSSRANETCHAQHVSEPIDEQKVSSRLLQRQRASSSPISSIIPDSDSKSESPNNSQTNTNHNTLTHKNKQTTNSTHKQQLQILNWNANSLASRNKIHDLQYLANHNKYDIIGVCETGDFQPDIPNYKALRVPEDRSQKKRGLVMYINKNLIFEEDHEVCSHLEQIVESRAIRVEAKEGTTIVWSIYVNPELHYTVIPDILKEAMKIRNLIIIGDFNARSLLAGDCKTNTKGRALERYLETKEMAITILNNGQITFRRYYPDKVRTSVIDLALTSRNLTQYVEEFKTMYHLDSDHFPIQVTLNVWPSCKTVSTENQRILNTKKLKKYFEETSIDLTKVSNPARAMQEYIQHGIELSSFVPKQHKRISPWWNSAIRSAQLRRNRALALPLTHPDRRRRLSEARRAYKKEIDRAKSKYRYELAQESQNIFNILKCKKRSKKTPNMSTTEAESKAKEVDKMFSEVETFWREDLNIQQLKELEDLNSWSLEFDSSNITSMEGIPVTVSSLLAKSLKCKNNAPGADGITQKVIKCFSNTTWKALAQLFNLCGRKKSFPDVWKETLLIAVPKASGGFRPISLLSKIGKAYEKQILNALKIYFKLPNWQHCQQRSSTQVALTNLHHNLLTDFENKKLNALLLFDIRKAFDSVNHNALIYHLWRSGVPNGLLCLLKSWLSNRVVQTCYSGQRSEKRIKTLGIPQGSPLSLYLFNAFISDFIPPRDSILYGLSLIHI